MGESCCGVGEGVAGAADPGEQGDVVVIGGEVVDLSTDRSERAAEREDADSPADQGASLHPPGGPRGLQERGGRCRWTEPCGKETLIEIAATEQ